MDVLKIEATDETPKVILDKDNNELIFSGKSLPEDVTTFYEPILNWLDAYAEDPLPTSKFTFDFVYFNTASSKIILDILFKLEELKEAGNDTIIHWRYKEEDEDMEEAGEEYSEIVEVPFEMESY